MFHKRPWALAFLLIAACGDSGERPMSTGAPFHHRLTLTPVEAGDGMKPQGPVLVKQYTAPEGLKNSSWKIEDQFDPKAFNQVVVSLTNRRQARAKIVFDETSRARESAVQDIAHDLRTPLASIKGASQNLLDGVVERPHVHVGDGRPDLLETVDDVLERPNVPRETWRRGTAALAPANSRAVGSRLALSRRGRP